MKKLFLIPILLFAANLSFGQTSNGGLLSRLSFGLKAGGNYSNFTDADFGTDGLAGFHAGAVVNFRLSDQWSLQQEFLYSIQGAKVKDNRFASDKELKLSYLSVPIMIRFHSKIGFFAELGAQANLLLQDVKDSGLGEFADKIDAGAVAGLGYQFRVGPVKGLGIGARYYQGFMDVGKFSSNAIQPSFKNSVAQLSVSYMF